MSVIDVIVGVKNESEYIKKCICSLQKQTFKDINIIIIDGLSNDRTTEIVHSLMDKDKRIRLFTNDKLTISCARNIGLNESKSEFIAYMDGHAFVGDDWLETLYKTFLKYEKICKLGGVGSTYASPDDDTIFGKTVAYCLKTLFGGMKTAYSIDCCVKKVDTVAFALYRKTIVDKEVIRYDESMTQCEDTDFNYNLVKKGYVLVKHPKAFVYQYRRKNLVEFFKQMYKYGEGRAKFIKKHHETLKLYHIMPTLLFLYLISFIAGLFASFLKLFNSGITTIILDLFVITLIFYLIIDLVYTVFVVMQTKHFKSFVAILIFPSIHIGYGIGFLKGLLKNRY